MDKFLNELRAQYWYWFIRDRLIDIDLERLSKKIERVRSNSEKLQLINRKKKLIKLKENPTTTDIYTSADMEMELDRLSAPSQLSKEFAKPGDKYKIGARGVPPELLEEVEGLLPGSTFAHEKGPSGLFIILEAETLLTATKLLVHEFLVAIQPTYETWNEDSSFKSFIDKLAIGNSMASIDISKQLSLFETAIIHLFPNQLKASDIQILSRIQRGEVSSGEFEPAYLSWLQSNKFDDLHHQPIYIELKAIAPIILASAFIKSRFLGDEHMLPRICFHRRYLSILFKHYTMQEEFWFFDSKGKERVKKASKSPIRREFHKSLMIAKTFYNSQHQEWDLDLSVYEDILLHISK